MEGWVEIARDRPHHVGINDSEGVRKSWVKESAFEIMLRNPMCCTLEPC